VYYDATLAFPYIAKLSRERLHCLPKGEQGDYLNRNVRMNYVLDAETM